MKKKVSSTKNTIVNRSVRILAGSIAAFFAAQSASASTIVWSGTTDNVFATGTNWVGGTAPVSGDIAQFVDAGGALDTISLVGGATVNTLQFDTASAAAYTIGSGAVGSQTLTLNAGGAITMSSTVAANELVNANVILGTDATTQAYTFTNESTTNSLTFAGSVSGGTGGVAGTETLTVNGAGATNISGVIGNGGATAVAVTKAGAGTLAVSGSNTYTGTTTINGGTLAANSATALGVGGNISFTGGTLKYSAASGAQDWGARIKNSTSAIKLDLNGQKVTIAGVMDSSNNAGLNVSGVGTLVLSGANGFTGNTTVTGSMLLLSSDGTGATNPLGAYPGSVTAANITLNGGASFGQNNTGLNVQPSAMTVAVNRGITLGSGMQSLVKGYRAAMAMNSVITGSGGLFLTENTALGNTGNGGGGRLTFGVANTYTGDTVPFGWGTQDTGLVLGNVNSLQNTTFDYSSTLVPNQFVLMGGNNNYVLGGIKGNKGLSLNYQTAGITNVNIGNNNQNTIYSGAISQGSLLAVTKTGTGTLMLSTAATNTGGYTVSNGTLIQTATGTALGTQATSGNNGLSVSATGTFAFLPTAAGALTLGQGKLTLVGGSTIGTAIGGTASQSAITSTVAAATSGTINLNISGIPGVTVTAGSNNLITAASGLNGGTINLGKIYNATNFSVTSGLTVAAGTVSVSVATATALTGETWKGGYTGGNNVWALGDGGGSSGNSNWTTDGTTATGLTPGPTAIINFVSTNSPTNRSSMTLGANMTIDSMTVSDSDVTPSALALNADGYQLTLKPASSANGITVNSGAGAVTLNSFIALGNPQTWTNNSANTLTIGGDVSNGANALTIDGSGNTTITGQLRYGAGALNKNGAGTLTLSGDNYTFQGTTTVNAGVVLAGSPYAFGMSVGNHAGNNYGWGYANVAFGASSTGTIRLNGNNVVLGSLSTNATVGTPIVENASSTPVLLTVTEANSSAAAQSHTYAGNLRDGSGGGSLSLKVTLGTLTLGGATEYTGQTLVDGGTLIFGKRNSNYANWTPVNMNVASGATLGLGVGDNASGYFDTTDLDTLLNSSHLGASTTVSGLKTGSILGFDTTNATAGTFTYNTAIAQLGGIVQVAKLGTGTLTLGGSSSYTAATNVIGGTLAASSLANGGSNSNIGASSNAAANLLLGNGTTFQYTGGTVSTDRVFTVNGTGAGHAASLDASGTSGAITFSNTLPILWGTAAQTRTFTLTGGNTNNNTFTPLITDNTSGVVAFNKTGAGTWVLNSAEAFTGTTTVNGGTLKLGVNNALQLNKVLTLTSGTLDLGSNSQYAGNFTGAGGILTGSGTFTTNAANGTFAGQITGSLGFIKAGANTLILTADNTTTGAVKVLGGGLTLNGNGKLSGATALTINNATLTIDNTATSINGRLNTPSLSLSGGGGTSGSSFSYTGAPSVNSTESLGDVTVNSGLAGIRVNAGTSGSAVVTMNSLTRTSGAALVLNNEGVLLGTAGNNPRLMLSSGLSSLTGNLAPVNGVIPGLFFSNSGGGSRAFVNYDDTLGFVPVTSTAGSASSVSTDNVTGVWALTGSQAVNSIKDSGGTFTFANATDTLTVTSGMIFPGQDPATNFGTTATRGALTTGTGVQELMVMRTAQGSGNVGIIFNSVIKDNGNPVKLVISSPFGTSTANYCPTLTAVNTYTGGTFVSGGLALLLQGTNSGDITVPYSSGNSDAGAHGLVIDNGTVKMNTNAGQIDPRNTVTLIGASTLTLVGNNTLAGLVFTSNGGGATAPTVTPTGILSLTGNISSTQTNVAAVPIISGGTLDLANTSKTITVSANPGYTAETGLTISSVIQSGTTTLPGGTAALGSIIKAGTGVLELSGANTFAGGLTINAGAVLATSAQGIGGTGNTVTLNNNAGLWLNSATVVTNKGSNILAVGVTNGTLASAGGDRTLQASLSLTGALNISLADPTINSTDRSVTLNSVISGSGSIVVSGATSNTLTAKALVLSSNGGNFFTGGLTINSGGRVQTTATNALGAPSNALTVNTDGVFDLVNTRQVISSLTGTGGQIISSNATGGTLLVGYGNGTGGNFAGILATGTGQIALTKLGSGTLTLSGNNTTTGATTILGGTLVLSGSPTGNSAITIQGGTLQLDYSTNNTGKINDSAVLTLAGGTLDLKGGSSNTEIVGSTSLAGGLNNITRSVTGSVLRMGAINTTTAAGIVDFGAASIASTTNTNDASGILGPWATLNNTWAVNSGTLEGNGNNYITAYSGAFADLAAQGGTITDGSTTHARINSAGALGNVVLSAATTTVSTLLQNSTTASTIETASKTLKTNGIMMGSGKGAVTIGAAAGDGALQTATASTNLVLNNKSSNLLTINAPITASGTSGLTVNGNVTLKGANTFTGPTGISGGTLEIASGSLNGGSYAGAISLGGGSTLKYNSSTGQTLSGVISGVGGITKDNGSTLTLSSSGNSFFGPIVVNNGTLTGSSTNAFGTNAIGNALTIANLPTAAVTTGNVNMSLGSLAGGGMLGGNLTVGGGTLTVGTDNTSTTYGGNINQSAIFNFTKAGLGTLTLTGALVSNQTILVNGGGSLILSGSTAKISNSPNFTMGNTGGANTFTVTNGAYMNSFTTYTGGGAGNPDNSQTGNTLNVTGVGSRWDITAGANGAELFDRGSNTLNISSGGIMKWSNSGYFFFYSNAVNNAINIIGTGQSAPVGSSILRTTSMDIAGTGTGSYNTITVSNAGLWDSTGANTFANTATAAFNSIIVTGAGSVWNMNGQALTMNNNAASNGNQVTVKDGGFMNNAGTITIGGINGALNIGDGNALAAVSANTIAVSNTSGRLNFNNGRLVANATGNMVSGAGQIVLNGPSIFSTNQAASTIAVATVISGTGSLTKQDTGTLTLSAPNTYTGATIVNGGTLVADTVTNATVLSSSSGLQLGGGTFQLKGLSGQARSQTLAGLTVNAGSSVVDANNVAGGTSTTIDLSGTGGTTGITRSAGGTVDFKATAGTFGTTAVVKTAQANNASGILGAWATVNGGADLAANNGSNVIVAYTGYGSLDAQAGGANGTVLDNTNANLRIDAAGTSGSVPIAGAITNINTLMQNFGTASTIDTSAGILRTGTNGGILITPSGQSLTIGTSANSGTLTAGGNTDGVAGDLLLSNASANTLTVNSVIANNAGGVVTLTKAGSGNVVLNGTNTYTGTTFLNAGTLTYGANNAIASGAVTVNGGTLAMSAFNDTVGAVTLKAGSITGSGTLTSTSGFTFDNVSAASASTPLAGSVGLTKSNLGTMTLSGASTYTGTTAISEGKLAAGVASVANTSGAFGNNSAVTITAAPSASIDITGFNTQIGSLAGGGASGGGVILGAATLTTGDDTSSTAYAGVISGTGAIVKNGTGTWTVSGASSYSGATTINAGTLKLGSTGDGTNSPLGTTGAGTTVTATGAALDLNGLALSTAELLALNGTGVSSGGALTNSAAGPAVFGGLISLGSDSSIVANNGAVIITNAGTIAGSGFALTLGGNAASTQVSSLASIIGTGAGAVTKTGSGTWLLSGVNTFTGQLTVENGTLATAAVNNISTNGVLGGNALSVILGKTGGLTGTLEFTNATSATSTKPFTMATGGTGAFQIDGASTTLTLQGLIDGGGGLTKTGAGTLKLNGATGVANTYSGLTTVSAGTLNLDKQVSGSLNQIAGNITVASGATLSESSFSNQIDDASAVTVAGTYSLSSSSSETIGTLTVNGGTVTTSSSNLELATAGTQLTMTGGTITLGNTGAGAGSLRLNGNVSIASSATSALIQASNLSTQTTSTLDLRGGTRTFNVATGTGAALGAELIVSTIIADGTGTGSISKSGNGTMVLNSTSASTYIGSTGVSAGTLLVTGSLSGTTAVSVSGGALEITAANRINDAATVTMSAGTFKTDGFSETVGAFTLSGTATIDLGAGASILQLANSSANTWSGGLSITNWSGLEAGGGTDQIFFGTDATGLTSGQIALVSFLNPAGFAAGTYGATQLSTGELVVVPEPGAAVSLLGGLGLLLGVRRRRK